MNHRRFSFFVVFACSVSACGKPADFEQVDPECFNPNPLDPEECLDSDDDDDGGETLGEDEISTESDSETSGPAANPGPCTVDANDGFSGVVWHCDGSATGTLSFLLDLTPNIEGGATNCEDSPGDLPCDLSFDFDPAPEWAETPDVMACCSPDWDPVDEGVVTEEGIGYCSFDMLEQTCIGMKPALYNAAAESKKVFAFGVASDLENMGDWFEQHVPLCTSSLVQDEFVTVPNDESWSRFTDFTITLTSKSFDIVNTGVAAIDQAPCSSNDNNDTLPLEAQSDPPGTLQLGYLTSPIIGTLAGPVIGGGRVFGSGQMGVEDSLLGLRSDLPSGEMSLVDLDLAVVGSVIATNGDASITLTNVAVRLYGAAGGQMRSLTDGSIAHIVDAEQAVFVLSGASPFETGLRIALNSSSITISDLPNGQLRIDTFVLEYTDHNGDPWMLTLPRSTWE